MVELGTDHRTQNMSPVVAAFLGSPLYVVHRMLCIACCTLHVVSIVGLFPSVLQALGAITLDGSWAIVDGSNAGRAFGQYGPQDPNNFPSQFYEVLTVGTTRIRLVT